MNGGGRPDRPLPVQPVTTTDLLIAELIHEIRALRDDLKLTPVTPIPGTVELREPVRDGKRKR